MNRLFVAAVCLGFAVVIYGCSLHKTNENRSAPSAAKESTAKPEATQPTAGPAQAGELQPGQATGTYTAKGQTVELKYAYAGHAVRFGDESLVVLLTDQPIPAEAVAEEIKSTPLLEGEKIRGLEYVIDENSMWVRFHPSQYQESGSNKLKEYKVENGIVRGVDENTSEFSDSRYARSVKFVAAIAK
jgi:hypothetical protein